MAGLRARASRFGIKTRVAGAVAVLGIIGGVAALADDPIGARAGAGGEAAVVADLPGRPLVDRDGRAIVDADGRPLRVADDGKTLIDSNGRPLTDTAGRPLRLRAGNRVPVAVIRRPGRDRSREQDRSRRPSPGRVRPPRVPPSGEPIRIAVAFLELGDHDRLGSSLGIVARTAEPRPQIRAVMAHINETGGILGRRAELVEFEYNPAVGTYEAAYKALCAAIAQARPLLAVDRHGHPKLLVPCLATHGVPLVASWPTSVSSAFFRSWAGYYISPGMLATDQIAGSYVEGLHRAGYFTRGAKLGLLHNKSHDLRAASDALRAELRRRGIAVAAEADVEEMRSNSEFGFFLEQVQRAVVRFKLADITHVMSVDQIGATTGLFMKFAHAQDYHPRYGVTSTDAPVWLAPNLTRSNGEARDAADEVLEGAVGVGWSPFMDVTPQDEPPRNRTRLTCDEIFEARGVDVGDRSPYAQYSAYGYCDSLLLVRAALERSGELTPAGLRAGVEALGTSFESALNLGTVFGPDRLFGASGFRMLRYHSDCNCFRYGATLG